MAPDSIDSAVTDPPYELGFMGRAWDSSGVAFDPETWRAVLRVLKPGAHLLAFGGSRTWHRIAVAIEDAGFEIRDSIAWMYGSGFPKSLDVAKAIARANEVNEAARRAWLGWGTALKPAFEPVIVARKPLDGTVAANAENKVTQGGDHFSIVSPEKTRGTTFEPSAAGRWPANVLLDEDAAEALDEQTEGTRSSKPAGDHVRHNTGTASVARGAHKPHAPSGHDGAGASRFFYTAKADGSERDAGLEDLPTFTASPRVGSPCRRSPHALPLPTRHAPGRDGPRSVHRERDGVEMETPHAVIAWHRVQRWAGVQLAPRSTGKKAARAVQRAASAGIPDLFGGGS
jgi:hypothetical protein